MSAVPRSWALRVARGAPALAALAALGAGAACGLGCTRDAPDAPGAPAAPGAAAVPNAPSPPLPEAAQEALLADLEREEAGLRASIDWARHPSSDRALGPDPIDVVALPNGRLVVALRGADQVLLTDADGRELSRLAAPRAPRALAVDNERVWAVGEQSGDVLELRAEGDTLVGVRTTRTRAAGYRGVARSAEGTWALDLDGTAVFEPGRDDDDRIGRAPVGALAVGLRTTRGDAMGRNGTVLAISVAEHILVALRNDDRVVVHNDGPFWGLAARALDDGGALVAVGHVEDHPLDRKDGSFAYIDSFVRVLRFHAGAFSPVAWLNVGERGLVTPKALAFLDDHTLAVAAAGSPVLARIHLPVDDASEPTVEVEAWPPGASSLIAVPSHSQGGDAPAQRGPPSPTRLVATSPLLDALLIDGRVVPIADAHAAERSVASRVGEALVFTNLMGPKQKSDGKLSRFSCEACHFEGGIDGRTHHTGRGDVHATTKPLLGLCNNKPLFTRGMDPNLAQMVHAEFRVAGAHSDLDPWFAVTPKDAPWLAHLGVRDTLSPIELRRALVTFLCDFTPRTNPNVVARPAFTPLEDQGADVFAARCAVCHAPRLIGDDAATEVPRAQWAALVLSDNGPLVWSSEGRRKTGVTPYVHDDGARPTSLRRTAFKRPYFTNGSASTLDEVLDAVRFEGETFAHAPAPRGGAQASAPSPQPGAAGKAEEAGLSDDEKRALRAFLRLL